MTFLGLGVVVILAAGSLNGCTVLAVGGAAAGGYYVAQDKRSIGVITDDASISLSIKAKLLKDDLVSPVDVRVTTNEGVVTLQGMVDSPEAASRVYDIAYSVKGVTRVISNLTIRSEAMTPWGAVDK